MASYLYSPKGYSVAVVDCVYLQHSISAMRNHNAEQLNGDEYYIQLAFSQFKHKERSLPGDLVLRSSTDEELKTTDKFLTSAEIDCNVVFFDLLETINSEGVIAN